MKTYTVGNLKGGVGKTTSTVNLGYSFSQLGKRVLLVDADPQANLTAIFFRAKQTRNSIRKVFQDPRKVKKTIYRTKYQNIDMIPGDTDLLEEDVENVGSLKQALESVADRYDLCLIDTRPAMERITLAALYASDVLLTPVCLDKFCRDNLLLVEEKYGAFCEQVREVDWKIFANKVENKKAQRNTYEDMSVRHCWPIMETCISKGAVVENALEYYKPVLLHRSKSRVAEDYMELAKELLTGEKAEG